MEKATRNKYIDILKGIAITAVVLGHSIQYGSGGLYLAQRQFFDNNLFKFIYSFHMPLFMLISGYLFYYSTNAHSFFDNLKSRFSTLLLPIIMWSFLPIFFNLITLQNLSFLAILKSVVSSVISNLWFLWAIFFCSIIVIIVKKFLHDNCWIYLMGFFLTFFTLDIFGFALYKFMYPFFIIGYWLNKYHNEVASFIAKTGLAKSTITIISTLTFLALLFFFNNDTYIYTTQYYILDKQFPLQQLSIDLFRFFIGLIGSLSIISLTERIYNRIPMWLRDTVAFIGKNSMGIYIISGYVFSYALPFITSSIPDINYALTILETLIILSFALLCATAIKKTRILNCILLGGRK